MSCGNITGVDASLGLPPGPCAPLGTMGLAGVLAEFDAAPRTAGPPPGAAPDSSDAAAPTVVLGALVPSAAGETAEGPAPFRERAKYNAAAMSTSAKSPIAIHRARPPDFARDASGVPAAASPAAPSPLAEGSITRGARVALQLCTRSPAAVRAVKWANSASDISCHCPTKRCISLATARCSARRSPSSIRSVNACRSPLSRRRSPPNSSAEGGGAPSALRQLHATLSPSIRLCGGKSASPKTGARRDQ